MFKKIALSILIFIAGIQYTDAASMYITPDKATLGVNELSGATIYLNSNGQAVNNVEGILSFDTQAIQVESIINSDSILSLWIEQPTYSNTTGKISFNGGIPNPGYKGSSGKIARVIFRTKKAGSSLLTFNSASIYANDGLGTDITDAGTKSASATIVATASETLPLTPNIPTNTNTVIASSHLPSKPVIESKDASNEENWYNLSKATFTWKVPSSVTAVQLLHGSFPNSIPQVIYAPAISQKTLSNLTDGIWYLHVRFRNDQGWGETAHKKFKIDSTKPSLLEVETTEQDDVHSFNISASDTLSGIERFEIKIEGETSPIVLKDIKTQKGVSTASTSLSQIAPGMKEITVLAYDKAQNTLEKKLSVEFKMPFISAPLLSSLPLEVLQGKVVTVEGTSYYPEGRINIYTQYDTDEVFKHTVTTDTLGKFTFEEMIAKGTLFTVWAKAENASGIESTESNKVSTTIKHPFLGDMLPLITNHLVTILLSIIFVLLVAIIFMYHRLHKVKKHLRTDLDKTKVGVKEVFDVIKKDNRKSAETLAKSKAINEEMDHAIETIREDLDQAEKYFSSRIKKIEKDTE